MSIFFVHQVPKVRENSFIRNVTKCYCGCYYIFNRSNEVSVLFSETHLVNMKGVPVSRSQILQSIPMYLLGCLMLSSTDSCLPVHFEELIGGNISLEQVISNISINFFTAVILYALLTNQHTVLYYSDAFIFRHVEVFRH